MSNSDCRFFLLGSCTKGEGCQFRHEPLALTHNRPCAFFAQGRCNRDRCKFRHPAVGPGNAPASLAPTAAPAVSRATVPCYWESQPSGCLKGPGNCPFRHLNAGHPVPVPASAGTGLHLLQEAVAASPGGNIIVNKAKLEDIMMERAKAAQQQNSDNQDSRVVFASDSALPPLPSVASTGIKSRLGGIVGGVKSRLGPVKNQKSTSGLSIKDRLGGVVLRAEDTDGGTLEVYEEDSSSSSELDSEEEVLRRGAIGTIDLRNRLQPKPTRVIVKNQDYEDDPVQDEDEDLGEETVKMVKKERKKERKEKKERKREKKERKREKKEKKKKKAESESPSKPDTTKESPAKPSRPGLGIGAAVLRNLKLTGGGGGSRRVIDDTKSGSRVQHRIGPRKRRHDSEEENNKSASPSPSPPPRRKSSLDEPEPVRKAARKSGGDLDSDKAEMERFLREEDDGSEATKVSTKGEESFHVMQEIEDMLKDE